MIGFKLDANGDISLNDKKQWTLLKTYQDAVIQRLQITMRTFKGEWFLNTDFGIPYRDTGDGRAIIGKGFTKKEIDSVFISVIKADPDVLAINSFRSERNPITRLYDLKFDVKCRDGDLRVETANIYPWDEITYEYVDTSLKSSCNIDLFTWTEKLHPIVHNDLPLGGQYTWIRS